MATKFQHVDRKDVDDLERVIGSFHAELKKMAQSWVTRKGYSWQRKTLADLLAQRKELNQVVKTGMTKRQDLEVEIGLLACMVWWNRKEIETALVKEFADLDEAEGRAKEREAWDKVRANLAE